MPTKKITVCSTCEKRSCDGGIWEMIELHETTRTDISLKPMEDRFYKQIDLDTIPEENKRDCTLRWGISHRKELTNKKIGDTVVLEYNNWSRPSLVTLRKIEK